MWTHRNRSLIVAVLTALWLAGGIAAGCGSESEPPAAPVAQTPATPTITPLERLRDQTEPDVTVESERWFVITLDDRPAGWAVIRTERDGDTWITVDEFNMQLRQDSGGIVLGPGGDAISHYTGERFAETEDGRPLWATVIERDAEEEVRRDLRFTDQGIELTTRSGGRRTTANLDLPEEPWLTPRAATRRLARAIEAGEREIEVRTYEPSLLQTVDIHSRILERRDVEVFGRIVPALELRSSLSILPGIETTSFVDEAGELLIEQVPLGAFELRLEAADRLLAQTQRPTANILAQTFVRMDRPIGRAAERRQAQFILSVEDGQLPDLPETAVQRFQRLDAARGRVSLDLDNPRPDPRAQPPRITRSIMIDPEDERIIELAQRAVRGAGEAPGERAEAMRRFVHDYIEETTLDVGLASASEVARTRRGDCTEFAVLLAAMLRADGIPSRVASGLIYVGEEGFIGHRHVFAYHMWTQAWIDGRWVDLDATLDSRRPFSATHITLSTSKMEDGQFDNDLLIMSTLVGLLRIEHER